MGSLGMFHCSPHFQKMGISIRRAALWRVNYSDKQTSRVVLCPPYCISQEHLKSDVPFWGCTKNDQCHQPDLPIMELPAAFPPGISAPFAVPESTRRPGRDLRNPLTRFSTRPTGFVEHPPYARQRAAGNRTNTLPGIAEPPVRSEQTTNT